MNGYGEEFLVDLIMKGKKEMTEEMKGAWCKVAECLPNRKVQSIHNLCKRKFNPNNYQGKWSQQEEKYLVKLIEERGHSWNDISALLNNHFHYNGDEEEK